MISLMPELADHERPEESAPTAEEMKEQSQLS
jgi:hypothetical protein